MTGLDALSYFSKFDGILHIPSTVVSNDTGHKAVKIRQEPKTKEQAQNVLGDDYKQSSAEILRFTFYFLGWIEMLKFCPNRA